MAKVYGKGKTSIESEEQQRLRWQVELEFVQCLANPNYLNFLAQRGYFKDPTFINYLKYLKYWKDPEYAKFIMYPTALYFLDLLQYESFRNEIVNAQCCKFIDDQAILQWQHYTRQRAKLMSSGPEQTAQANNVDNAAPEQAANAESTSSLEPQPNQQASQPQNNNPATSGGLLNGSNSMQPAQAQINNHQQMNGMSAGGALNNIKLDLN